MFYKIMRKREKKRLGQSSTVLTGNLSACSPPAARVSPLLRARHVAASVAHVSSYWQRLDPSPVRSHRCDKPEPPTPSPFSSLHHRRHSSVRQIKFVTTSPLSFNSFRSLNCMLLALLLNPLTLPILIGIGHGSSSHRGSSAMAATSTSPWSGLLGAALAFSIDVLASLQNSDAHRLLICISTAQVTPKRRRDAGLRCHHRPRHRQSRQHRLRFNRLAE